MLRMDPKRSSGSSLSISRRHRTPDFDARQHHSFSLPPTSASCSDRVSISDLNPVILLPQISAFLLRLLDLRQMDLLDISDAFSVESCIIQAFQCFVMKLSEKQFKPVLDELLDWMFHQPISIPRCVAGFHLLAELMQKLKSLFVVYVPAFLDTSLELCASEDVVHKKGMTDASISPAETHAYLLKFYILQCLYRALLYDEDDILHQQSMERILSVALRALKRAYPPSDCFTQRLGEIQHPDLRFKHSEIFQSDPLSLCLAMLLIQLGGQSGLQKSVNHKVIYATVLLSDHDTAFLCRCCGAVPRPRVSIDARCVCALYEKWCRRRKRNLRLSSPRHCQGSWMSRV